MDGGNKNISIVFEKVFLILSVFCVLIFKIILKFFFNVLKIKFLGVL